MERTLLFQLGALVVIFFLSFALPAQAAHARGDGEARGGGRDRRLTGTATVFIDPIPSRRRAELSAPETIALTASKHLFETYV